MITFSIILRRYSAEIADRVLSDCGLSDGGHRLAELRHLHGLAPAGSDAKEVAARLNAHPDVLVASEEAPLQLHGLYQPHTVEGTFSVETFTATAGRLAYPFTFPVDNVSPGKRLWVGVGSDPNAPIWTAAYTLSLNANQTTNPGGTVTFATQPTVGNKVVLANCMVPAPSPHSWPESRHLLARARNIPLADPSIVCGIVDSGMDSGGDDRDGASAIPESRSWHSGLDPWVAPRTYEESQGPGNSTGEYTDGVRRVFQVRLPCYDRNGQPGLQVHVDGVLMTSGVSFAPVTSGPRTAVFYSVATFEAPPAAGSTFTVSVTSDRRCDDACVDAMFGGVSHGSACHSTIAAKNNNGLGVSGVSPEAPIAFAATADWTSSGTSISMYGAAKALMLMSIPSTETLSDGTPGCGPAKVISCSWGMASGLTAEQYDTQLALFAAACDFASARDALLVVAAGNDGMNLDAVDPYGRGPGTYAPLPTCYPKTLLVGGIDEFDARWNDGSTSVSRTGSRIDITAPARYFWENTKSQSSLMAVSRIPPDAYWSFGGTSGATPHVAGVAWRVRAINPALTADEVREIIKSTCDRSQAVDPSAYSAAFPQAGILNGYKACAKAAALRVPGSVYPHVQFFKPPPWTPTVAVASRTGTPTDGPWAYTTPGGNTTLNGPVVIDIAAYSTDANATVELQVGGVAKYSGSPALLSGSAAYNGSTATPVRLIGRDGTGTIVSDETFSDVLVTSLESVGLVVSASDATTSTDVNQIEVKSPAFATADDATASSDSTSCVLALASTVAVPFLVAASIVAAVLYDTATADTGSFGDTVTIARKAVHVDSATFAETIAIGLGCGAADTGAFSDVAAARIGIYSAKTDSNTFADSVGATLLLVSSGVDATTSADTNAIEQTFPATVEVSDATTTQDTNATLAAIGQSDATGSVDTAYAYVGIIASVSDSTGSSETMSATVYATPPVDVEPIEAVADPVKVGMLAGAGPVGVVAQSVPVGMVYRRNGMQIGKAWQGCDFPVFFPKEKDAIGQAIDLAGATLLCSAKIGTESVAASATSVDASAGTGQAVFSAAQTATWPTGVEISFDGVYRLANGRTYPAGTGKFWVADPITPTP